MKKTIMVLCILTTIAAITGVAIFIYGGNSRKLNKQLGLAQHYLEEMDYEQAIIAYEMALEIDSKNTNAYLGLIEAYLGEKNFEKSLEVAEKGFEITGEEVLKDKIDTICYEMYLADAEKLIEEEKYEQAEKVLKNAIEVRPDDAKGQKLQKHLLEKRASTVVLSELINSIDFAGAKGEEIFNLSVEKALDYFGLEFGKEYSWIDPELQREISSKGHKLWKGDLYYCSCDDYDINGDKDITCEVIIEDHAVSSTQFYKWGHGGYTLITYNSIDIGIYDVEGFSEYMKKNNCMSPESFAKSLHIADKELFDAIEKDVGYEKSFQSEYGMVMIRISDGQLEIESSSFKIVAFVHKSAEGDDFNIEINYN